MMKTSQHGENRWESTSIVVFSQIITSLTLEMTNVELSDQYLEDYGQESLCKV